MFKLLGVLRPHGILNAAIHLFALTSGTGPIGRSAFGAFSIRHSLRLRSHRARYPEVDGPGNF